MTTPSQSDARTERLAGLRAELAGLRAEFAKIKQGIAETAKAAAKRRDDWLLEHTRKEHL